MRLGFGLSHRAWLKAPGTGHKARIIKKNVSSPYALRLKPYASSAGKAIELCPPQGGIMYIG